MKEIRRKISVCVISICIGITLLPRDVFASPQSDHLITPFPYIIGWRYKKVNGKLYRCRYNYSKEKWIGEWEPC